MIPIHIILVFLFTLCVLQSCKGGSIDISAVSAGFDDGNKIEIKVNGESVIPPGGVKASNGDRRGIYVATLRQSDGALDSIKAFHVYGSRTENYLFQSFVSNLLYGTIVVMAVKDEGSRYLDIRSHWLIEALGSRLISNLKYRDSWCMISRVGAKFGDAYEQLVRRQSGFATIRVPEQKLGTIRPPPLKVDINLLSAGFEDGNTAGMLINGRSILSAHQSPNRFTRGLHVGILKAISGVIIQSKTFDTYALSKDNLLLQEFITGAKYGQIVIIVVMDEASQKLDSYSKWLIEGLGSRFINGLGYRDSWCMFGKVGAYPKSVVEDFRKRKTGHATLRVPSYSLRMQPLPTRSIRVRMFSAGFDSGNRAAIFVNGVSVFKYGLHGSPSRSTRGLNIAVVGRNSGLVLSIKVFDTYGSAAENTALQTSLKGLTKGDIVMISVMDTAGGKLDSTSTALLKNLGSKLVDSLQFRDSWCFLTTVGNPLNAKESLEKRFGPPATLESRPYL